MPTYELKDITGTELSVEIPLSGGFSVNVKGTFAGQIKLSLGSSQGGVATDFYEDTEYITQPGIYPSRAAFNGGIAGKMKIESDITSGSADVMVMY